MTYNEIIPLLEKMKKNQKIEYWIFNNNFISISFLNSIFGNGYEYDFNKIEWKISEEKIDKYGDGIVRWNYGKCNSMPKIYNKNITISFYKLIKENNLNEIIDYIINDLKNHKDLKLNENCKRYNEEKYQYITAKKKKTCFFEKEKMNFNYPILKFKNNNIRVTSFRWTFLKNKIINNNKLNKKKLSLISNKKNFLIELLKQRNIKFSINGNKINIASDLIFNKKYNNNNTTLENYFRLQFKEESLIQTYDFDTDENFSNIETNSKYINENIYINLNNWNWSKKKIIIVKNVINSIIPTENANIVSFDGEINIKKIDLIFRIKKFTEIRNFYNKKGIDYKSIKYKHEIINSLSKENEFENIELIYFPSINKIYKDDNDKFHLKDKNLFEFAEKIYKTYDDSFSIRLLNNDDYKIMSKENLINNFDLFEYKIKKSKQENNNE